MSRTAPSVADRPVRIADSLLDFSLPPDREASAPPEARGLARDGVRLMVSRAAEDRVLHARFRDIGAFLRPGDLIVLNTSGTRAAAVTAARETDGLPLVVHFSTRRRAGEWTVELRRPAGNATEPFRTATPGDVLLLPGGGRVTLRSPHGAQREPRVGNVRLWEASVALPGGDEEAYFARHGAPIRYGYVPERWPLSAYQTVYATETGSAEMPSAGRAFTPEGITRLVAQGVRFAPLLLHTGVASLEDHEPPYAEWYRVPAATARAVNETHAIGGRVIAVGTTVVRALETVTDAGCVARAGEGWTEEIITPERGSLRAVDGLLTGLHEPRATHLAMLESLAGRRHLVHAYREALAERCLWHEFGDLHLLLP